MGQGLRMRSCSHGRVRPARGGQTKGTDKASAHSLKSSKCPRTTGYPPVDSHCSPPCGHALLSACSLRRRRWRAGSAFAPNPKHGKSARGQPDKAGFGAASAGLGQLTGLSRKKLTSRKSLPGRLKRRASPPAVPGARPDGTSLDVRLDASDRAGKDLRRSKIRRQARESVTGARTACNGQGPRTPRPATPRRDRTSWTSPGCRTSADAHRDARPKDSARQGGAAASPGTGYARSSA